MRTLTPARARLEREIDSIVPRLRARRQLLDLAQRAEELVPGAATAGDFASFGVACIAAHALRGLERARR